MRSLGIRIDRDAGGIHVQARPGERQGLIRLVGEPQARHRARAVQQNGRAGIQSGVEIDQTFRDRRDVAFPVGIGVPLGIRAFAVPDRNARARGERQIQVVAVRRHAEQSAGQARFEVRSVHHEEIDVESGHRRNAAHDLPRIILRRVEARRIALRLDHERSARQRGDAAVGIQQVPGDARGADDVRHVHLQGAVGDQRDGPDLQPADRAGGVAGIYRAAEGQRADRSIAHQHADVAHLMRRVGRSAADDERAVADRGGARIRVGARHGHDADAALVQAAGTADDAVPRRVAAVAAHDQAGVAELDRARPFQRADRLGAVGMVERRASRHPDERVRRRGAGQGQAEHAVADQGGAGMGRRPRQGRRSRAVLDEIQHVGPNAEVRDDDAAGAAQEEVVRGVGGVDAAGQGQGRVGIRVDPRGRRQSDCAGPRVVVLHVAQRTVVGDARARQPQGFHKIRGRPCRPQFQRATWLNRRPSVDRVGAQGFAGSDAQRSLGHGHRARPMEIIFFVARDVNPTHAALAHVVGAFDVAHQRKDVGRRVAPGLVGPDRHVAEAVGAFRSFHDFNAVGKQAQAIRRANAQ